MVSLNAGLGLLSTTLVLGAILGLALPSQAALGTVVRTDDFEGASLPAGWSGSDLTLAEVSPSGDCTSTNGFCGTQYVRLGQTTATLSLTGLSPHTQLQVDLDLFAIASWDGNGNVAGTGPDRVTITVDGTPVLDTTFSNTGTAGNFQSYPDAYLTANNPEKSGAFEVDTLGSCCVYAPFPAYGNAVYRFPNAAHTLVVAHTATTATIAITNGANEVCDANECLGVDNVVVSTDASPVPVPEFSTLVLAAVGVVGIGALALVRRRG